jgi:hypothetical protein
MGPLHRRFIVVAAIFAAIILAALGLAACSQGGSSSGRGDCSDGVCVALRVVEPVQYNAPVVDLGVTLCGGGGGSEATIDGPQGWESNAHGGMVYIAGPRDCADWSFAAKANADSATPPMRRGGYLLHSMGSCFLRSGEQNP